MNTAVDSQSKILLVGCYGLAGEKLVRHLLQETEACLILAGRDPKRVAAAEAQFGNKETASRLEKCILDATDYDAVCKVAADAKLLVNATGPGPQNRILIDAAIETKTDWIDMQMSNELLDPEQELKDRIEASESCFVIQAGFHPGVPAALVRYAAQQYSELKSANVGAIVRPEGGFPYSSGIRELVAMFKDYQTDAYIDGQWKALRPKEFPRFKFGHGFGEILTYPMVLPEMKPLPELIPSLKHTGLFITGFNWFADYLVAPLLMAGARFAPKFSAGTLGRLLCWSTRVFSSPPYGTVLKLDASGIREGQESEFSMFLFHEDGYEFTVIPTVAMIRQMLSGKSKQSGIHMMGVLAEPDLLLSDMERMGISIEREFTLVN